MTAPTPAENNGTPPNVKPLVPKQGGRIATLEAEVAQLHADMGKLKRVVAEMMMSNPQVQQRIQDLLIAQIEQRP